MLHWAAIFFVISLVMAAFGFGGFATSHVQGISRVLFFVFLILSVLSVVFGRAVEER